MVVDNSPGGIQDPYDLKYVEEAGNGYAFVVNYGTGKLLRFDFGQNLTAVPTPFDLGNFGVVTTPLGIGFWTESNSTFALMVTESGTSSEESPFLLY